MFTHTRPRGEKIKNPGVDEEKGYLTNSGGKMDAA